MNFRNLVKELESAIEKSYIEGISMEDAEKLAGKFLFAQLALSTELKKSDLDARMKKSGLKAAKAAVYLAECQKSEKKPSDKMLEAIIDSDKMVADEQQLYDSAEASSAELERIYDVLGNAHIHFRSICKGRFD